MKELLKKFGPGWITGASDDDPSGIGTYTYAGSRFGFGQLWLSLFTIPLMSAVQEMCARIGMVTGKGLAGVIRQHHSRTLLSCTVALLLCANTINIAANIGAMGAAMQLLIDIPFIVWALFFTFLTLVLEIFVSYITYARYLKYLTISLFAYVLTALLVTQDWKTVFLNLLTPHIFFDREFLFSLVAIFGTTISPYLFFWQTSSEVEEEIAIGRTTVAARKGANLKEIDAMRIDVFAGMIFSNLIAFFIMLTAASTLFPNGIVIETAQDAARALQPLAGDFASLLFAVGIIGTGLLSIPILAGSASYAFAEGFGWRAGLSKKLKDAHGFYGIITLATIIGLAINFIGINPIRLLIWAAVVNACIAPFLLTIILRIGNNRKIMGTWRNGMVSNVLGWTTVALMGSAVVCLLVIW